MSKVPNRDAPEHNPSSPPWRRGADAQLLGWAVVALAHTAVTSTWTRRVDASVHLTAQLYNCGELLAAGLVSAIVVGAWMRWGPRHRLAGWVAFATVSIAVGGLVLAEDLGVAASKLPGPTSLVHGLMIVGASLLVPAAAVAGRILVGPPKARRGWGQALATAAGAAAAIANAYVLPNDYPGVHLVVVWSAAVLAAVGLSGVAERRRSPRWVRLVAGAVIATGAAASLSIPPSNGVAVELLQRRAPLAPFLLRATVHISPPPAALLKNPWYGDRDGLPPVRPTEPALITGAPIVILVTIDALRADVLEIPEDAAQLPTLRELARTGVWFTNARSPASQTNPSIATLFTGKYFSQLYWTPSDGCGDGKRCPHEDESVRFPELLSRAGVDTVTFTVMPGLRNRHGLVQGFTEERYVRPRAAETIVDATIARLEAHDDDPLFVYFHLPDAHAPYNRGGVTGSPHDRWLREVAIIDAELGRLWAAVAELRLADRTVLIVSADHGEAFGEHDTHSHATTLYEELLRVPLIVKAPGVEPSVVDQPVGLVDVGPTVLDLMQVETPATFMGQSLVPLVLGRDVRLWRPLVAESSRAMRAMVFRDGHKAIVDLRHGTHELYDLSADPGELNNLADDLDADEQQRFGRMRAFFSAHQLEREGYELPYVR